MTRLWPNLFEMFAVASFLVMLQNETSELRERPTSVTTTTSARVETKRAPTTEKASGYRASTR